MKAKFELDLACIKDELRPTMNHVKVDKKYAVATDAYLMAYIPTDEIFHDDFIDQLPEGGILIHREDWAKLKRCDVVLWNSENTLELVHAKKRNEIIKIDFESNVGKYPVWQDCIPNFEQVDPGTAIPQIGVNGELMGRIQKVLGAASMGLTFSAPNQAIKVYDLANPTIKGLVMPVMVLTPEAFPAK